MTGSEKADAEEKRLEIFYRDNWTCCNCYESIYKNGSPQLAHGISKGKRNIEKYGAKIIHSCYNMYSACSLKCNHALSVGKSNEPAEAERIRKLLEG